MLSLILCLSLADGQAEHRHRVGSSDGRLCSGKFDNAHIQPQCGSVSLVSFYCILHCQFYTTLPFLLPPFLHPSSLLLSLLSSSFPILSSTLTNSYRCRMRWKGGTLMPHLQRDKSKLPFLFASLSFHLLVWSYLYTLPLLLSPSPPPSPLPLPPHAEGKNWRFNSWRRK